MRGQRFDGAVRGAAVVALSLSFAFAPSACTSSGGDDGAHGPAPSGSTTTGSSIVVGAGTPPPARPQCLAPPAFLSPIVVARPGELPGGVIDAWLASVDEDRTLVVAAVRGTGAPALVDLWWTLVDRRRRSVAPWKTLVAGVTVTQIATLSNGVVAAAWNRSDSFAFQGDARVFRGEEWSPSLSSLRTITGSIMAIAPLGADGAIAAWPGGASTLREDVWSAPLSLRWSGGVVVQPLADGGAALPQVTPVGGAILVSPLDVDARGGWSTSGPSPLAASTYLVLDDGTTMVALLRPRGDGLAQIWTAFARPPQPWSAPAPLLDDAGAPVLVDVPMVEHLLFRLGDHGGELVAWTTTCAPQECERKPTAIRFVDGAWSTPIDLSWGPGTTFERRHVFTVDGRLPMVVREGAFRVRLGDDWSDVAGVSDGPIGPTSTLAAARDGVWMMTSDPSSGSLRALFVDVVRHTTARTELPKDFAGLRSFRGFVDASGAFVLAPALGGSSDVLRWETPDATPETMPLSLEGELLTTLLPTPAMDAPPSSEIFVVTARVSGAERLRIGAWNGGGEESAKIEGGHPFAFRTEWRGCGGALLYGYADASTPHVASTILLLPIR